MSSSEQSNWWQKKDNNYSAYDKSPKTESVEDIQEKLNRLQAEKDRLEKEAQAQQVAVEKARTQKEKAELELKAAETHKQEMSDKYDSVTEDLGKCGNEWAKIEKELEAKPMEQV